MYPHGRGGIDETCCVEKRGLFVFNVTYTHTHTPPHTHASNLISHPKTGLSIFCRRNFRVNFWATSPLNTGQHASQTHPRPQFFEISLVLNFFADFRQFQFFLENRLCSFPDVFRRQNRAKQPQDPPCSGTHR